MAKKNRYQFIKKEHPVGGKIACLLAVISVALMIAVFFVSYRMQADAGSLAGGLGLISMGLAIYGFIVGMRSFSEKKVSPLFPAIGSISCGVLMVAWLTIFLMGIS